MAPITLDPTPPDHDVTGLTAAFQTFNRSSRRLEEAYRRLLARVHRVDQQLVEANRRLHRKVEELDSLTRYLNDILASMHSGVVAVDGAGRITSFNRAAERVLGVSGDAVRGKPHGEVLRHTDGSASPLALTLSSGQPLGGVEREVAGGDGGRLCLNSRVAPIRNARGELVGAVEIFSDLTEVRELQERLERADKLAALGQMAAQVAHEVRNPLNSIEGFASLLVRDLGPDDPRRGFAERVVRGARSVNQIVTNMLEFSRPFVLHPRRVSVCAVLEEALAFAVEEARQDGRLALEVRRDYAPDADAVEADPDLLRQALLNLLLNACQAMAGAGREAGRVSGTLGVATRRVQDREPPGGWVEVRIEDSGPGIAEAVRERLGEPFVTTKAAGSGLGLAIVQKIARRHGGRLELDSEPGCGTVAVLALPVRQAGCGSSAEAADEPRAPVD